MYRWFRPSRNVARFHHFNVKPANPWFTNAHYPIEDPAYKIRQRQYFEDGEGPEKPIQFNNWKLIALCIMTHYDYIWTKTYHCFFDATRRKCSERWFFFSTNQQYERSLLRWSYNIPNRRARRYDKVPTIWLLRSPIRCLLSQIRLEILFMTMKIFTIQTIIFCIL